MTLPGDPFEEQSWSDLARSLRELLGETVSGLAGVIGQERTVAIAQAFLSLGDQVARHAAEIPERERQAIAALIARLAASSAFAAGEPHEVHVDGELLPVAGGVAAAGIRRVNFFNGKLLTAADLRDEQTYQIERRRLHNRALHGPGVVDGLQLRLEDVGAAPAVTVNRGFALDPRGREVILSDPLTLAIPAGAASPLLVVVEYSEQPADPVPVSGALAPIPFRIEEGAQVRLLEEPGGAEGPGEGIAVGRLLCQEGQWRIDPAFEPQRPRH